MAHDWCPNPNDQESRWFTGVDSFSAIDLPSLTLIRLRFLCTRRNLAVSAGLSDHF